MNVHRVRQHGIILFCFLIWIMPGASVAAEESDAPADVQQALDDARQQLDEAARHFAELTGERLALQGAQADGKWAFGIDTADRKARLGVMLNPMTNQEGAALLGVTPGSGAEEAGLQAGDVVLDVNGTSLKGLAGMKAVKALTGALKDLEPGDLVSIGYTRDNTYNTVEVTATEPGQGMVRMLQSIDTEGLKGQIAGLQSLAMHGIALGMQGLQLFDAESSLAAYFGIDHGVLVLSAPDTSGLIPGDILRSVAGEHVSNVASALRKIRQGGDRVEVEVLRQGASVPVSLKTAGMAHAWSSTSGDKQVHVIKLDDDRGQEEEIEIVIQDENSTSH